MAITAQQVKELREMTGVGMMDCKKALVETDGDMEKAVTYLREKGLANAAKKAGRIAAEGAVGAFICDKCGAGALVEVNCETDFVAKTDSYMDLVKTVAQFVTKNAPKDVEELLAMPYDDEFATVSDFVKGKTAVIGEKIDIRRFDRFEGDLLESYIHMGGKIGVMLQFKGEDNEATRLAAHNITMHIAATNPLAVSRDDLDPAEVAKEKEIQTNKALEEGKPAAVVEKMIVGRMQKYFAEVCLLEQEFVVDPDFKVGNYAKANGIEIVRFTRFAMGEGLQKRVENFAEEVAKQM